MRRSLRTSVLTATTAGAAAVVLAGCAAGGPTGTDGGTGEPVSVAALTSVIDDYDSFADWRDDYPGRRGGPWGGRHPFAGGGPRGAALHGELTVQTDDGPRTVVGQRGTVESVDGSTLTVESIDGFTLDWTCADECRVVDDGDEVELSQLDLDAEVRVVGVRDGDDVLARIVRHPGSD
ncbi:hypothetical protein O7608_23910 [Solwaraspora sp. WMMA2056]|uniref:hypothetical protein n=1 Tax=Solwaraspora sp. WMMA2056 TaxID=3015161 RepID=UPI00259BB5A1|nr:hypothetical protein [Solwaraspora sp. WMMA2056]WJK39478.1 hypothetical protein O7608_23910 [Solwaraspora sp. WMMA2056]